MTIFERAVVRILEGQPDTGFRCGREEQDRFLYEYAWGDEQEGVSVTHLYYVHGILAGYATVLMDSILLGSRERGPNIRYKDVPALKLGQLGVHHTFQGSGLGSYIVAHVIELARRIALEVGCRYVTLDAHPVIAKWYENMGFVFNKEHQKVRVRDAERQGRELSTLAISMRFDIRQP